MDGTAAAQLQRVGVAEQAGAGGQAAGAPVAEDHRGEADVAAAGRLALAVDAARATMARYGAAEAGEGAGHDDGDVLVLADVDAERRGGVRRLAARAQTQAERRAPQDEERDPTSSEDRDDRDVADVGGDARDHAGEVGDEEPALLGDRLGRVGDHRQGDARRSAAIARRLRRAAARNALEQLGGEELGDAEAEDVDGDTGHDLVDARRSRWRPRAAGRRARRTACATTRPDPRAPLVAGPAGAERAEDHHALEADVDHARALGPQTAETGHADRHREAERRGDRAGGGRGS